MTLAQWISGRLIAQGIRGLTWLGRSFFARSEESTHLPMHRTYTRDDESRLTSAATHAKDVKDHGAYAA